MSRLFRTQHLVRYMLHFSTYKLTISSHSNMENGHYFAKSDLVERRLVLNIGHHCDHCSSTPPHLQSRQGVIPDPIDDITEDSNTFSGMPTTHTKSTLTIVTSTGICKRSIWWWTCSTTSDKYIQLIRARLFPASFKNPQTVFTFEVLDHFRLDALECKTAAMNFMSKICQMTDEAFPLRVLVSYPLCWIQLIIDWASRIIIGSFFGWLENGWIFIIECSRDMSMIGLTCQSTGDWPSSAPLAHRWVSIYLHQRSGTPRTCEAIPQ